MKRLLAFIIVVLAVPASAAFGGGEGGAQGKSRAGVYAAKVCKSFAAFYNGKRNGWNAFAFRALGLVVKQKRRGLT